MKTFRIEVRHEVAVTVDETKFTPEFLAEFQSMMFCAPEVTDHAQHLARMYVTGDAYEDKFVEGYGELKEFGVRFRDISVETEDVT